MATSTVKKITHSFTASFSTLITLVFIPLAFAGTFSDQQTPVIDGALAIQYTDEHFTSRDSLAGCIGQRYRITLRYIDFTSSIPESEQTFPFIINTTPANAITVHTSANTTAPIQESRLANGKADLWIQSTTEEVINGKITITLRDRDIAAERANIFFTPCTSNILTIAEATYYSDNESGAVDRLILVMENALTEENLPDSLVLFWPERTNENKRTIKDFSFLTLQVDPPNLLIVPIDPPFIAAITKPTGSPNLGTMHTMTMKPYGLTTHVTDFDIHDGVGPLLRYASLTERLSPGNDTLLLVFSEPVALEKVCGTTLYLIKSTANNSSARYEMNVLDMLPISETRIKVITNLIPAVAAEDSLKIIPTGTITDKVGNHANPQNRPVNITLKPIPPSITDAAYFDSDADGTIDSVMLEFNKNLNVVLTTIELTWNSEKQTGHDFIGSELTTAESSRIAIPITDKTFYDRAFSLCTSGEMTAKTTSLAFVENNTDTITVKDRAAPVIKEITYTEGLSDGSGTRPDILKVKYSEVLDSGFINGACTIPVLYSNINSNDTTTEIAPVICVPHSITLSPYGYYHFVVDPVTRRPLPGATGWINTDDSNNIVMDTSGNRQLNPGNRRVAITIQHLRVTPPDTSNPTPFNLIFDDSDSRDSNCGGCGTGSGLAFIPPMMIFIRKRLRKTDRKQRQS